MLSEMDLDYYELSYYAYSFFQPATITSDAVTTMTKPHKTYLEASQVQESSSSPPDAPGRSADSFNQSNRSIPVWYVLLYNQSTVVVLSNTPLLTNICQYLQTLRFSCNSGTFPITLVGDLKGCGIVWFHPKSITNILYLTRINDIYHVTYYSSRGNSFKIYKEKNGIRRFVKSP